MFKTVKIANGTAYATLTAGETSRQPLVEHDSGQMKKYTGG